MNAAVEAVFELAYLRDVFDIVPQRGTGIVAEERRRERGRRFPPPRAGSFCFCST